MHPHILPPPPSQLKDHLLLASPALNNSIFDQSCILITSQSNSAHEGFIINHQSHQHVSDILKHLKGTELGKLPLHLGGPVRPDTVNFIRLSSAQGKFHLQHGLKMETAAAQLQQADTKILACLGYAQWAPQQLEQEFDHFTWFHRRPPADLAQRHLNTELWKTLLTEVSPYHELIANAPPSPRRN